MCWALKSIIGIPMQVVAELVIGFVIFGAVLVITKGSDFFIDLASALLGHRRGGPAKVAVVGSGILGSLSGSVISNILTIAPFSIPTMRRVGYPASYAAAIEACASTGATLMPPVMGTVAFVMASFLGVQYSTIVIAAIIPALLFYVALLFQVDMYAARTGLKGLPREEIPPIWPVLKSGWPYLLSLAVLIYVLMGLRMEARSPYYASAVMLIATSFRKETRLTLTRAKQLLLDISTNIASLVAILAGIGLVVGGLSYTGVAGAFSRELLLYAGGNTAADADRGGCDQLRAGHGDDGDGLLYLPVHPAGAGPDPGRAEPDRQPPVHPVLGDAVLYHAARRAGGHHRSQRRGIKADGDRIPGHAPGDAAVRAAVHLRL